MGRTFDERKYLREYLEIHPEYQPRPGYITKEGLISFAGWLIEQGYCKLGKQTDAATIQVVLSYLHSERKLFGRSGRKIEGQPLYTINWEKEKKDQYEFVRLAAEIEDLISKKAERGRNWKWLPRKVIEQKAKELGIPVRKLISVGIEARLFKNVWWKKRIQAVDVGEVGRIWTRYKQNLESYRALKNTLKEQGYSLRDPEWAGHLKRLRKKLESPGHTYIE